MLSQDDANYGIQSEIIQILIGAGAKPYSWLGSENSPSVGGSSNGEVSIHKHKIELHMENRQMSRSMREGTFQLKVYSRESSNEIYEKEVEHISIL